VTFLSVCSGIEAASVAAKPLHWKAVGFAEIDPVCCALLKHYYPKVRNYGDFTKIRRNVKTDVVCGGTPCQDFAIAGPRTGLDGTRGNLTLEFTHLVERIRPQWVVWENVPGVLSANQGRAFGTFLSRLAELRYGCVWRVLDAQYFGVPQRRRRVFVVGYLGDWRRAAAVLFEPKGLRRNHSKVSSTIKGDCGVLNTLTRRGAGSLREEEAYIADKDSIRHLTPLENERAMGFPDHYTLIRYKGKPMADSLRLQMLGNSWAVPVVRWIFGRIDMVNKI
jgi:DNA (cytosine-5)-methyltransferase 1